MSLSSEDIEEVATELLAVLSLDGECALELLVVNDEFLMFQEYDGTVSEYLEVEELVLDNAVERDLLVDYLEGFEHLLGDEPVYLVGTAESGGRYRIRWAR